MYSEDGQAKALLAKHEPLQFVFQFIFIFIKVVPFPTFHQLMELKSNI